MADYYQTLGIKKGAPADEIKKAYRKLALKHHPDRNKGDKGAEEEFKKISEAYAVLSDPQKKKQYDTFGDASFHQRYSQEDIFRGADFGSIFDEFDLGGVDDIFGRIFGAGGGGFGGAGFGRGGRSTQGFAGGFGGPPKGQDVEYKMRIGFHEAYTGGERALSFRLADGTERNLKVKVPAGVADGGKLRVAGQGAPGQGGGKPGDLFVVIEIAPHPNFVRKGKDIEVGIPLKISEALLGTAKEVNTPEGEKRVKIPAGVKPGTKIRLKGLGFPQPGSSARGDLYAVVEFHIPTALSEEQKSAIEALQNVDL